MTLFYPLGQCALIITSPNTDCVMSYTHLAFILLSWCHVFFITCTGRLYLWTLFLTQPKIYLKGGVWERQGWEPQRVGKTQKLSLNLVKAKRKMFFITSTLIVHQTELRNSSPEIGSNKVEEKVKLGFIKTQQLSVTMQNWLLVKVLDQIQQQTESSGLNKKAKIEDVKRN